MARTRSYRKNSDDLLGTFINNARASSQKRATADRRARDAAAKRAKTAETRAIARAVKEREREQNKREREAEKRRSAAAKEAESQRKADEKERERVRKESAKHDKKVNAVFSRVLLELETAGLFPGESTATRIACEAVDASVTPAKAKQYFISPKEDLVARHREGAPPGYEVASCSQEGWKCTCVRLRRLPTTRSVDIGKNGTWKAQITL